MAKGGPEVGNTEPMYDADGNITGWTTPENMYAINQAFSTEQTETNTVPIYDATFGGGDVIRWVSPATAEQINNPLNPDTGSFDSGFRVGTTPADSDWGKGAGISTGGEVAEGDFDWVDPDSGRALYNPGWSFGADGQMYWYGDGPRPSDAEARRWAEAHLANAGQGMIPGSEDELGLGGGYNSPAPEYDYGDEALDEVLKYHAGQYVPNRPKGDIEYSGPSGTQGVSGQVEVDETESDGWGGINSLFGFENSSNADFYQEQARAMRGQSVRNQMRENWAREQAREAANAPQEAMDPWAWAGGEEQFAPVIGTDQYQNADGTPLDPIANPNFNFTPGETTNADLMRMFASTEAMAPYRDNIQEWLGRHPGIDTATNWAQYDGSGDYSKYLQGDLTPKNREMLTTMFEGMYVQPGDIRDFGRPTTPYGYASTLSPTTAAATGAT